MFLLRHIQVNCLFDLNCSGAGVRVGEPGGGGDLIFFHLLFHPT